MVTDWPGMILVQVLRVMNRTARCRAYRYVTSGDANIPVNAARLRARRCGTRENMPCGSSRMWTIPMSLGPSGVVEQRRVAGGE